MFLRRDFPHVADMVVTLQHAIGANIRAARLTRGWTQEQLAEQVGCAWETVSKIERGRNPPAVKTLREIGRALTLSIDELMNHAGRDISRSRLDAEAQGIAILHSLDDSKLATAIRLLQALGER